MQQNPLPISDRTARELLELVREDVEDARARLELIEAFAEQVAMVHDPDIVRSFLAWTADPVLDTILNLAARLTDERRHHVIHFVEDQLAEASSDPC